MAQATAKKLEHTEPAEKERVASVPDSSWQVRLSRLCQKEKSRQPSHSHIVRWETGGSDRDHREEKVDSTVKDGRFQGGEGGQARRASLGEVEGSMSV